MKDQIGTTLPNGAVVYGYVEWPLPKGKNRSIDFESKEFKEWLAAAQHRSFYYVTGCGCSQ